MSAVQGRDGQDVHEGEDDTEESGHLPEHIPVPHGWEKAADGSKAAERLRSVCRKHVFHVAHIAAEHITAVLDTGRDTLQEAVFLGDGLIESSNAAHHKNRV